MRGHARRGDQRPPAGHGARALQIDRLRGQASVTSRRHCSSICTRGRARAGSTGSLRSTRPAVRTGSTWSSCGLGLGYTCTNCAGGRPGPVARRRGEAGRRHRVRSRRALPRRRRAHRRLSAPPGRGRLLRLRRRRHAVLRRRAERFHAVLLDDDHTPRHVLHPSHAAFVRGGRRRPHGGSDPPWRRLRHVVRRPARRGLPRLGVGRCSPPPRPTRCGSPNCHTGGEAMNTVYVATVVRRRSEPHDVGHEGDLDQDADADPHERGQSATR